MILSKQINFQNKTIFVLQFGLGLVGKSINSAIKDISKSGHILISEKINWSSISSFENQVKSTSSIFSDVNNIDYKIELNIIWSAGKVGFSASDEECEKEFDFFTRAISILISEFKSLQKCSIHFCFISSAGGLFEGQKFITKTSKPAPLRPYGRYKLSQENLLANFKEDFDSLSIVRPSSVYSNYNIKGRKGLISVLIENGISNRESVITGSDDTQRDYVLDLDIGNFVANNVLSSEKNSETYFLIDGKSSSIQEIRIMVESMINRKLILRYSNINKNSADMCFWPGLKPKHFNTSMLSTNVRILYNNLLAG